MNHASLAPSVDTHRNDTSRLGARPKGGAPVGNQARLRGLAAGALRSTGESDAPILRRSPAEPVADTLKVPVDSEAHLPAAYSNPNCPDDFCRPYANLEAARVMLGAVSQTLLTGIGVFVSSRVLPLWNIYMAGGSSTLNLTPNFGADFTNSPTTADATDVVMAFLRRDIALNQKDLIGDKPAWDVDFTARATDLQDRFNDPDATPMNFNLPKDIPGNIAGGIGPDQTAHKIGAQPSPQNDARQFHLSAVLQRVEGGVKVYPKLNFRVIDTVDLCPGDCGAPLERVATVPLSRFEATGLVGDVPFTVDFPAPADRTKAFIVGATGVTLPPEKEESPKEGR